MHSFLKKTLSLSLALSLLTGAAGATTLTGLETETIERDWASSLFFPRMEALTGVSMDAHAVSDETQYADLIAAMAQGSIPADVLFKANLSRAQEQTLLESGALIDLAPLIEANMPNLSALLAAHPDWRAAITLDDGLIMLRIEQVTDTDIICTVLNSGKIKTKKGVNVPGVHLSMPYLSQKDREDIIFGVQNGFDFIAASFVRTAQDVYDIRNLLNEYDSNIRIIAKIENREGVNNIDSILSAADAVMVARGDLGVEIDFTELPGIQKDIIDRSFSFGKPIVTATQMLDSMMVNPRPTRAEISDVANAIYDGTSAIMLSGETAAGAYPVEALKTMSAIAERTENEVHYRDNRLTDTTGQISVSDATAHAACLTAKDVNASAIVTVSESGNTARLLSKYRPSQPIIACVMDEQVQRQLSVSWGITPLMMDLATSTDELIEKSTALAKEHGYLHDGELAVVTAGVPVGVSGTTNMIKIHMIGNCLATGVGVGPEGAALANATGKACVCRTIEEIRAKFKPGMVLVVPSTSNEMLSYVRDAAALVVEEAGLNSHAAIAGKALLKPTIVGAVGATAHIRDGLMVAVDCAHGSVQRLQA